MLGGSPHPYGPRLGGLLTPESLTRIRSRDAQPKCCAVTGLYAPRGCKSCNVQKSPELARYLRLQISDSGKAWVSAGGRFLVELSSKAVRS